jgi:hypothetical protein
MSPEIDRQAGKTFGGELASHGFPILPAFLKLMDVDHGRCRPRRRLIERRGELQPNAGGNL